MENGESWEVLEFFEKEGECLLNDFQKYLGENELHAAG